MNGEEIIGAILTISYFGSLVIVQILYFGFMFFKNLELHDYYEGAPFFAFFPIMNFILVCSMIKKLNDIYKPNLVEFLPIVSLLGLYFLL